MRPRRLLRLISDFDGKIRYHLGKASIAADALSRNERAKPLRVRALVMTINLNLPLQVLKARVEALKKENVKDENLHGMDKEFKNRLDGTFCIRRRSTDISKITRKPSKNWQTWTRERKSTQKAGKMVKLQSKVIKQVKKSTMVNH
ncbi:hypothetical protein Tco_1529044 [Tanacetum coccineum]